MTRQRKIILEQLREIDSHPAADEVYEMVRRRLPRISLGTVYRNLEVLSARGMIRKLELGGSQRRFDGDMANHYHVRCIRCDRVEDAPIGAIAELEDTARRAGDFDIVGHQLQFLGICPACRTQGSNSQTKSGENGRRET